MRRLTTATPGTHCPNLGSSRPQGAPARGHGDRGERQGCRHRGPTARCRHPLARCGPARARGGAPGQVASPARRGGPGGWRILCLSPADTLRLVLRRPGGELASRPLPFFWLADCSGSMARDGKIQALNNAAREALPHMREVALGNPHAQPLVRVLRFATGAQWTAPQAVPVDSFTWSELAAGGVTDLGAALSMVAAELAGPATPERALPPVIVLVSDGQPTDDFEAGLAALGSTPSGSKAVRLGIAVGRDADHEVIARFLGDPALPILQANAPEALVRQVRWASTVGLASASSPAAASPTGPGPVSLLHEDLASVPAGVLSGSEEDELEIW